MKKLTTGVQPVSAKATVQRSETALCIFAVSLDSSIGSWLPNPSGGWLLASYMPLTSSTCLFVSASTSLGEALSQWVQGFFYTMYVRKFAAGMQAEALEFESSPFDPNLVVSSPTARLTTC